jgi:hypothetical protein
MAHLLIQTNPFILMMDPQTVLAQVEHSERLERLQRRICHPLDKPRWGAIGTIGADLAEHDRAIDAEPDDDE